MVSQAEETRKSEIEQQCSRDFVVVDVNETAPSSTAAAAGAAAGATATAAAAAMSQEHERDRDSFDSGRVCRVCHLTLESDGTIELGCACKNELSIAHQRCATTWFTIKGSRICEICGQSAENVTLDEQSLALRRRPPPPPHLLMSVEFNVEMQEENSYTVKRALCNLLLSLCVVIPFLPWLFRVHLLKL